MAKNGSLCFKTYISIKENSFLNTMTIKQILPIVCMALIGASCSDEVTSVNSSPVQMTFNVSVDETISRAGSNENLPTRAFMYVSDNNGTVLASAAEGTKENDSFKFSIELDRSASYTVAFWADKGGYTIDATAGLKKIGYEDASNLYPSVGFADCLKNFSPTSTTLNVELKHAVGQIVIHETETLATGDKVKISFTRNNYTYSAADQTYTLTDTDTPAEFEFTATETVNKGDIISAYMLAPNKEQKAGSAPSMLINDFKLTYTHSGESKAYERAISNVPVKSNSRTVISGSMEKLAKVNQSFSISFDTSWDDDITPSDSDETPSTPPTDDDNDDTSDSPVINLTSAGSLTESRLTNAIGAGNSLKITGAMSDNDFKTLCKYLSKSGVGGTKHLSLDLSGAGFTTMPDCAFHNSSTIDDIYGKNNSDPVSGLSKIILPEGLTTIPDGAFADCVNLSQITIPTTVTAIGEMSFYRSGLTTLNATSVITVGGNACEGCGSLTTVTLGNLTEILSNAFRGCTSLTTFDITRCNAVPNSGNDIFGGVSKPIPNLTIYVANESIRASLSANQNWTTQNPTFVVGAPSGN